MNDYINRWKLLQNHDNDYGFLPKDIIKNYKINTKPSITIVVPYYNTGDLINLTIKHLVKACKNYDENKTEIIIIDDDSKAKPLSNHLKKVNFKIIKIIKLKKNRGRTVSRNTGIKHSSGKYIFLLTVM